MGNSSQTPVTTEESNVFPISTVQSPLHIPADSFQISTSYLHFCCNSTCEAEIIVKFFLYEHGLTFAQDSTRPLPSQEFQIGPGFKTKIVVRLNQAYAEEFIYEPPSSLPIVIEAISKSWTEVTILEIVQNCPKVLQQRVVHKGQIYKIQEIFGLPTDASEERDKLCVVCLSNLRDTIAEPCCHICLCRHCADLMRSHVSRRCPMCRKGNFYIDVTSFIKIS